MASNLPRAGKRAQFLVTTLHMWHMCSMNNYVQHHTMPHVTWVC